MPDKVCYGCFPPLIEIAEAVKNYLFAPCTVDGPPEHLHRRTYFSKAVAHKSESPNRYLQSRNMSRESLIGALLLEGQAASRTPVEGNVAYSQNANNLPGRNLSLRFGQTSESATVHSRVLRSVAHTNGEIRVQPNLCENCAVWTSRTVLSKPMLRLSKR